MIRFILEGKVILTLKDKGYFKRNLMIDVVNHKDPNKNLIEGNIALPMVRDYDIVLRLGKRPETDLGLIEEIAREKLMDQEALRSIERQRLLDMKITDPHHPDYIAPDNVTEETAAKIEEAIEEESLQPLVGRGYDPEEHIGIDTDDDSPEIDETAAEHSGEGKASIEAALSNPDEPNRQNLADRERPVEEDQTETVDPLENQDPTNVRTHEPNDAGVETSDVTEGGSDTVHPVGEVSVGSSSDIAPPDSKIAAPDNSEQTQQEMKETFEQNVENAEAATESTSESKENPGGSDFKLS